MREYLIKVSDDRHMALIGIAVLLATVFYLNEIKQKELKQAPVVEAKVVACRPVSYEEDQAADVEFRLGSGGVRRKTVKFKNEKPCVVGQTVMVQYSIHSNRIEVID